ncbi:ABC transporter permease [Paenibacillus sp.]|uniref:ABC transporter permease n=1 Tax=Paenibacillus sp. TaxID=58172 RepID=UPI0028B12650|nr:ABC transporter permease [Paenibacillus sp.]
MGKLYEIYNYREMLKSLVRRDLRTRYKGSFFGFLWTFINPLMQLIVYSIIFPYLLKFSQENYAMYLFVALLPWNYFNSTIIGSCAQIINNGSLITKIYFPREVIPLAFSAGGLCNMFFAYIIVFPMLLIFNIPLTFNLLWLPVLFIIQFIMCTGFSLIISAVNVYFRDVEHILTILMMALYFFTPIMYEIDVLPRSLQSLVYLNPMTLFTLLYRDAVFYGAPMNFEMLGSVVIISVITFIGGMIIFNRMQKGFAEVL